MMRVTASGVMAICSAVRPDAIQYCSAASTTASSSAWVKALAVVAVPNSANAQQHAPLIIDFSFLILIPFLCYLRTHPAGTGSSLYKKPTALPCEQILSEDKRFPYKNDRYRENRDNCSEGQDKNVGIYQKFPFIMEINHFQTTLWKKKTCSRTP